MLVDPAATPYLAHRGVIVAIGRAPSPERLPEAVAWWDDVHLIDLLSRPGILAAIRFQPVDPRDEGILCTCSCAKTRPRW